jgi:bacterioferritin-associated ferredoxin
MIICVCAVLREEELREMAKTMTQYEIEQSTGACQQCNSCHSTVKQIVSEVRDEA